MLTDDSAGGICSAVQEILNNDKYRTAAVECSEDFRACRGAAGAAEALACIFALQENTVPPTIHLDEPDPELDLNYTPNTAVQTQIDTAISTSLGFGGHNTCLAFRKVQS